ncbi:GNAT family N-acetyltransferase [Lewinella sp. JB7]|uniref:GNAT family N-acetyltransferase n=1 Tax=Lewinella sp. JB7 TaxID=2962887 RepID=UPI0020C9DD30|nr:GNAT family N-acetyltransferase [Lewinella sp. JB7]MCP9237952.1 GNAT family N-acetyltransferase [Lewinella sp. JB7]
MQIKVITHSDPILHQVIVLGDKFSKTVGHLPQVAYEDYAHRGGILVAVENESLMGHVLFRPLKRTSQIKIAQLCVDNQYQGVGVADKMLEWIIKKYDDSYAEIQLTCRADYKHASQLWKRNHFYPLSEKPGRGKAPSRLIIWSFRLSKPNLFTTQVQTKVAAVVDLNIVTRTRDINDIVDYPSNPIRYLYNDNLVSEVDFYHANESYHELLNDPDTNRRNETRRILDQFYKLKPHRVRADEIFHELCQIAPPNSKNDHADRRQLSETIANNIEYFITTDERLKKAFKDKINHLNVEILTPTEFIIRFDQIQNKSTYLPRNLGGMRIEYRRLRDHEIDVCIDQFYDSNIERKAEFKSRFKNLITHRDNISKIVLSDRNILAVIIYKIENEVLSVQLLRISDFKNKYVLFNQIISQLVNDSIENLCRELTIDNSWIDGEMRVLLTNRYFRVQGNRSYKVVLFGVRSRINVLNELSRHEIDSELNSYELERLIYPGKIDGLEINNLIIPIRPYWAGQLFDSSLSNETLFGAKEALIWNRSNIYFRSTRPDIECVPSRILWYASSSTKYSSRTKSIIGCSYIEDVSIDYPKDLYKKYKSLGTYEWHNIKDLCSGDLTKKIKAIEFSDTEVFARPISLDTAQKVLGKPHTFPSPLRISGEKFLELYNLTQ